MLSEMRGLREKVWKYEVAHREAQSKCLESAGEASIWQSHAQEAARTVTMLEAKVCDLKGALKERKGDVERLERAVCELEAQHRRGEDRQVQMLDERAQAVAA